MSKKIDKALAGLAAAAKATQVAFKAAKFAPDEGPLPFYLKFKKLSATALDRLERSLAIEHFAFPPSYRTFVAKYGLMQMDLGNRHEQALEHMMKPECLSYLLGTVDDETETLAQRCVAFQYENDDSVENFIAFAAPAKKSRSKELAVVSYFHDEPFNLEGLANAATFEDHILGSIAELQEMCEDYELL